MQLNTSKLKSTGTINWKHVLVLIIFSAVLKVGYFVFSASVSGSFENVGAQYLDAVKKNDAYWYQHIAENGYSAIENKRDLGYSEGANFKQSEWAFFPFYPALNALTFSCFGLNFNDSAFIWSLLFSVLSIVGMFLFATSFFKDDKLAFFAPLVMFSFPFSFYFSMFYTEAVFFTFTIFSFLCIHSRKYLWLTILLVPLTLVRANGIIVLLPLYLYFLEQNGVVEKFSIRWNSLFSKTIMIQSLVFITGPLAFIGYGIYQYKMTGYFFAFSIAQDGWYREPTFPLFSFFRKGDVATQFNSVYAILAILYALWIRKKLPVSFNVFIVLSFLLPLCSGSVTSMTRFISVMFPLFMVFSIFLYRSKYKYILLASLLCLHFYSYYSWVINHPISF